MKFDPASEIEHTPKLPIGDFREGEPTKRVGRERGKARQHNKGLLGIALFKWLKGAVLLLLSFGLFKMLHRDVGQLAEDFANKLRVDPDNRYLGALLAKLNLLDDKKLAELSGLTFAYSALFFTEGTGLFFERRWAEYLTIVATANELQIRTAVPSADVGPLMGGN